MKSSTANGADGTYQTYGAETEEKWHGRCADCYAEQQCWRPRRSDVVEHQHEDQERVSGRRLVERLTELERRLEELERRIAA